MHLLWSHFRYFPPSLLKARLDFDFPPFILNKLSLSSPTT